MPKGPGHPFKKESQGRLGPWKEIHPSPTAGRSKLGGIDLPDFGGIEGDESRWIRCKQCGFPLDPRKVSPGNDRGNFTFESITTLAGGTALLKNAVRNGGCEFCGASNYGEEVE